MGAPIGNRNAAGPHKGKGKSRKATVKAYNKRRHDHAKLSAPGIVSHYVRNKNNDFTFKPGKVIGAGGTFKPKKPIRFKPLKSKNR